MKNKQWKIVLLTGVAVLFLLAVWFYMPVHQKFDDELGWEIEVQYQNNEVSLLEEQTQRILPLVKELTCQRRLFFSSYQDTWEAKKRCQVEMRSADHRDYLQIYILLSMPEESYIDTGDEKYMVLDAEPLLEEIEKIVKENEEEKRSNMPVDETFWELLAPIQQATYEERDMIVYDEIHKDITPVYVSSWKREISKSREDFYLYLSDRAQELIIVQEGEAEDGEGGKSLRPYTVLYYHEVTASDEVTKNAFVFRIDLVLEQNETGLFTDHWVQNVQVASAEEGWTVTEVDVALEVLEDGRVKGYVSYEPVSAVGYQTDLEFAPQYVSFWLQAP